MPTTEYISSSEAASLAGLLRCRTARSPAATAYRQFDAATGAWQPWTWSQVEHAIARWCQALAEAGLTPGDRVALMLRNSVEWVLFDQAALSLGLVVVPIYAKDNPENAAFILGDSGSRLLLIGESRQWSGLAEHRGQFPALETVVALDHKPDVGGGLEGYHAAAWLPETGTAAPLDIAPDALASIVYTSGTTGRPKGVMLSHRNILANAEAISQTIPVYREDVFLSFLPLSHMLERTTGYYYPMMAGSEVAFARSIQTLGDDMQCIRPTVLISVPRMFERAYVRIEDQLARKGALMRHLFSLAENLGWQRFEWSQGRGRPPGLLQRTIWPLLHVLLVKPVLARLGGRLRVAVSGGGRLDEKIARRFIGFGVTILQGYGLTETSPVVCGNVAEDNVPDSVGKPMPGVEVRVAEGGELLVRGANVMLGYWQRPEATTETIDADGWLHTGDVAEIVDGRIFIRGRIKEIIVTSTGEKVPPADLETAICRDPLFHQVMVVGEGKPYLAALLVLQQEEWARVAAELGVPAQDPASLHAAAVSAAVLKRIESLIKGFPAYARVRAVHLTLQPWTLDEGLLTPTLKLRRARVMTRFEEAVNALYAGHERPPAVEH